MRERKNNAEFTIQTERRASRRSATAVEALESTRTPARSWPIITRTEANPATGSFGVGFQQFDQSVPRLLRTWLFRRWLCFLRSAQAEHGPGHGHRVPLRWVASSNTPQITQAGVAACPRGGGPALLVTRLSQGRGLGSPCTPGLGGCCSTAGTQRLCRRPGERAAAVPLRDGSPCCHPQPTQGHDFWGDCKVTTVPGSPPREATSFSNPGVLG